VRSNFHARPIWQDGGPAALCPESTAAAFVFVFLQPSIYVFDIPPRASAYVHGRFWKWRKAHGFVFDISWRSQVRQNAILEATWRKWGLRVGLNSAPTFKRASANTEPVADVIC